MTLSEEVTELEFQPELRILGHCPHYHTQAPATPGARVTIGVGACGPSSGVSHT